VRYHSTRGKGTDFSFSEALLMGLAPDGGLFIPESIPKIDSSTWRGEMPPEWVGPRLLKPFLEGDPLADRLGAICDEAFAAPIYAWREMAAGAWVLELFHGPTAAFKDLGARFLAACLTNLPSDGRRSRVALVATSGDTGTAVAASLHRRKGIQVTILYPKGKVAPFQERQLTCWGENVCALAVAGTFDDCQRLVKAAFADKELRTRVELISANSINVGRFLPQMIYFAAASVRYLRLVGRMPGFIVPTGNLGNAVAALYAQRIGFPISEVVISTNANRAVAESVAAGEALPRPAIATLANAMDVGNPSNLERLLALYPKPGDLSRQVRVFPCEDTEIREAIGFAWKTWKQPVCPHTATAVHAWRKLGGGDWILAATAHPAKFRGIVEGEMHSAVGMPECLRWILERPVHVEDLPNDEGELKRRLVEATWK